MRVNGTIALIVLDPSLDLRVRGTGDAERMSAWAIAEGERPRGTVAFDLHASGPFTQGADVRFHDVRQQRGAHGAVRSGKHAANRRGIAVHRSEARIRQRNTSIQTRQRHIFPRGPVSAVVERPPQRARGAAHSFDTDRIGRRIGFARNIRFDELRERVETGAGGQFGREVIGEFGIDERDFGQQKRAAQADFQAMFRRGKHCVARRFRAGAGGRRDGDKRRRRVRQWLGLADNFEIIEDIAFVRYERSDGFAGVDGTAAAEAAPTSSPSGAVSPTASSRRAAVS